MPRKPRPLEIAVPRPEQDRPLWGRVGAIGLAGLVAGLVWPHLAGIRVGPKVPGADRPLSIATAPAGASPLAAPAPSGSPQIEQPAAASKPTNRQRVVVGEGTVARCWHEKQELEGAECGALRMDGAVVPRLELLADCPSAVGLSGELAIGFDLDFGKQVVTLLRGKKPGLPPSTVDGMLTCARDYVSEVALEQIPHKYRRYQVFYKLTFYPPGTAPEAAPEAQSEPAQDAATGEVRGTATVGWDTALIRDEPQTGQVLARLVRGTRVVLLARRKDWYRVRHGSTEGWVYRGAVGR
ncbi:MAG: SH3 domain-containing protein [Deltaproteobacteria bacterium]|nr:SH3 domain-containing protein [Deltaproteobacteria bacterium]